MHVVVADPLTASALDLLTSVPGWTVDARSGRPPEALARDLAEAAALIVRSATRVEASLMAAAPGLRVIARAGTGVDNVDLAAATSRGILVINAPGANSVSVAEHTLALMLALARRVPAADAALKRGSWDKNALVGAELRGKTLGLVGLGRIGQEVGARAKAFGMELVAHDPFISERVARSLGIELIPLDALCARADFISLHAPATPDTHRLFDAGRFRLCRRGVRIVNTARGELINEADLADAIEAGHVAGAALDVFETEPPPDLRLARLPQVVATPHIAASTTEAQEQVGLETAAGVRDFLLEGTVRNAVNFPAVSAEEMVRLRPYMLLAERLGALALQLADGRTRALGVRHYGPLVSGQGGLLVTAAVAGMLRPMLSSAVTIVNARDVAAGRGIEIIESRSSRPRHFANLLSVKLHTSEGERWLEGTVFEPGRPRLTMLDGVEVEAPLEGTLLVLRNDDQPGVIGQVGSILGRCGINIASFALGRATGGAAGVVNLDARALDENLAEAVRQIRAIPSVRDARLAAVS
ncbi:MAG TPA: phosphoglycerate dehydrogenase [Vicinamibacterales bacterium]|nr:phosphoglycerate dehydrogenase [Vicinamibacterales bacterium]